MRGLVVTATLVGAGTLVGCGGHTRIASPTGDGGSWFQVTCPWGSDGCFEEASSLCPNGYEIDQRHTKAGKPRNFSAWRSTLIRCKSPDEDRSETASATGSSKSHKSSKSFAAAGLKTFHAARWSISAPGSWTMSKAGKKTVLSSPDGKNEVTIETVKPADPVQVFAATRFKGWHDTWTSKVGGREAVFGDDFDGTSQTTAIALVVDGIGYQVSCVDVDEGATSDLCLTILRSTRVDDETSE